MYLRDALRDCSRLAERTASLFDDMARIPQLDRDRARHWRKQAETLRQQALIMTALLAAHDNHGDEGPFLIEVRPRIVESGRLLARSVEAFGADPDESVAAGFADWFGNSDLPALFREILDISRDRIDELRRLFERALGDNDSRRKRRATSRPDRATASEGSMEKAGADSRSRRRHHART